MRAVRADQLAGCRGLQTLRRVAGLYLTAATRSHDVVQGLLRANGALVFVHCSGRGLLNHCRSGRSRDVCGRSTVDGRHYVVYGYCVGNSLPDRSVPAPEVVGLGVWIGIDLYWSNKCLLYARNDTVIDKLD